MVNRQKRLDWTGCVNGNNNSNHNNNNNSNSNSNGNGNSSYLVSLHILLKSTCSPLAPSTCKHAADCGALPYIRCCTDLTGVRFRLAAEATWSPVSASQSQPVAQAFSQSIPTSAIRSAPDGCILGNAVHSVTIALRHFALGVDPTAASWDFDLLDGHGGWRAEGCHITGSAGNTTTIRCTTRHNNFAVLMRLYVGPEEKLWRDEDEEDEDEDDDDDDDVLVCRLFLKAASG
ncbi:hypothetical protein CRUP_018367 [Coryphaenoides rupestris]|nr:hypothetical protein CRUP_018367 [Coryphaenoides rupestris]